MKTLLFPLLFACTCSLASGCQSAPVPGDQKAPVKSTSKTATPQAITPRINAPGAPGIAGTVVDALTKAPLAGLTIKLWGTDETSQSLVIYGGMQTDAKGHYGFSAKANKNYKLELPDTQTKHLSFSSLWVDVPRVQNAVTQNIARPRRGVITGSVRDAAGKPVSAVVSFQPLEHEEIGHNYSGHRTNLDGSFRFEVDVDPYTGQSARYSISVGDEWEPKKQGAHSTQTQTIEVSSHVRNGDETRVDFVLSPRAVVRGVVTSGGRPVPGCELRAGESEGDTHYESETTSDAQGHFEMHLSAPGTWKIRVVGPKESSTEFTKDEGMYNRLYGFADVTTSVECKTPGEVCPLDIVLPASASLSGKVIAKTGQPLAGAKVSLKLPGSSLEAQTKADGTYSFSGLPESGPYNVELLQPSQGVGGVRQSVTLNQGKTTRLDFDLRPKKAVRPAKRATSTQAKKRRAGSKQSKTH